MAMFEESTEAGTQDWNEVLKSVIPYIDFFVPSVEELCIMLDRDRYHEWNERANGSDVTNFLDVEKDIRPLADKLLSYGAKVILIKCGTPGIYFRTAAKEQLLKIGGGIGEEIAETWAVKEAFEKSYFVEKRQSSIWNRRRRYDDCCILKCYPGRQKLGGCSSSCNSDRSALCTDL